MNFLLFLGDLSGLPPEREVEFCIDVIPDTQPYLNSSLYNGSHRIREVK